MKFILSLLVCVVVCGNGITQFHQDSLVHYSILPNTTDPLILAFGSDDHQVFYNPTSTQQNTLLIHLVGSGDSEFQCAWLYMLGIDCNQTLTLQDKGSVNGSKNVVKILDLLGRETQFEFNTPLIYLYNDGSRERVLIVE